MLLCNKTNTEDKINNFVVQAGEATNGCYTSY